MQNIYVPVVYIIYIYSTKLKRFVNFKYLIIFSRKIFTTFIEYIVITHLKCIGEYRLFSAHCGKNTDL